MWNFLVGLFVFIYVIGSFADDDKKTTTVEKEIKKPVVLTVDQKIDRQESTIATLCTQAVKTTAKYPSKVDPDWGFTGQSYKDFSGTNNHRFLIKRSGDMMNGLGMMVPYEATCKVDWNHVSGKTQLIEFYLNGDLLYSK